MITNQTVLDRVQDYITALEADARDGYATYELVNTEVAKYHRIVGNLGGQRSVHAFVDFNGQVFKPAGWKGPTKRPVYDLLNDDSYAAILRDASWSGRHLYAGQQSYKLAA